MKRIWYWTMFAVESAGMIFILYEALPLYQRLLRGPGGDRPGAHLLLPGVCIVIVMQICYWTMRRIRPRIARRSNAFVAHLLLFLSRLSFIFAGALLSLMLFNRSADTRTSPFGIVMLLATAFAQFCYVRELEALSRKFEEQG
jgi:hypothetical protein